MYDKQEDFQFEIVQFSPKYSTVSRDTSVGVVGSQLIRYFRICNDPKGFEKRENIILDAFLDLKFDKKLLFNKFRNVADRQRFQDKHGMSDNWEIYQSLQTITFQGIHPSLERLLKQ